MVVPKTGDSVTPENGGFLLGENGECFCYRAGWGMGDFMSFGDPPIFTGVVFIQSALF